MEVVVVNTGTTFNSTHYTNVSSISYNSTTGKYTITQAGGTTTEYTATSVLISILPI